MMKILLFGGAGRLGSEIIKLSPKIIAPAHDKCDITKKEEVESAVKKFNPELIIHAAALVGTQECENNKDLAWKVNVEGTHNVVKTTKLFRRRLIFISSAAIFDGKKGNYKETDTPNPAFYYAITKVVAEQIVKTLEDYIIIRLDFFPLTGFKYQKVFIDHYTSKIPVPEAAEKILKISKSNFKGTINIGQKRKTLFNILRKYYPNIVPIKISDSVLPNFPKDLSLDLSLWNRLFN